MDLDLDNQTKALVPPTKQTVLQDIIRECTHELSRTQIYPRTQKTMERILELAEKGLQLG